MRPWVQILADTLLVRSDLLLNQDRPSPVKFVDGCLCTYYILFVEYV